MVIIWLLWLTPLCVGASGPGPNGINIGFDFNWADGPLGHTASFVASTSQQGASLNNCGGPVTETSTACNFVFNYRIGGVPQTAVPPGGVYQTYASPPDDSFCDQNPRSSAPLTLFSCFNTHTFGQVFRARESGLLSDFTMSMTCLNPAGTPLTGLFAVIYEVAADGLSVPASPLASAPLDLSTCPTLTSWEGHLFSTADFAPISMPFNHVSLTAGHFYAVYFSGLVPGSNVPGGPRLSPAAQLTPVPTLHAAGLLALVLWIALHVQREASQRRARQTRPRSDTCVT